MRSARALAIAAAGARPSRRHAMRGGLSLDVWYDGAGRLGKIRFRTTSDRPLIDYLRLDMASEEPT